MTSTPGSRPSAAWCSRCSSGSASCRAAIRARSQFTGNGEIKEIANHPGWIVPQTDPERFKKAADEILKDAGVDVHLHTHGGGHDHAQRADRDGHRQQQGRSGRDRAQDGGRLHGGWRRRGLGGRAVRDQRSDPADEPALPGDQRGGRTLDLREKCTAALGQAHERGELGNYGGPWMHRFAPNEIYFNTVRVAGQRDDPRGLDAGRAAGPAGRLDDVPHLQGAASPSSRTRTSSRAARWRARASRGASWATTC